jgi:hypothetical protein
MTSANHQPQKFVRNLALMAAGFRRYILENFEVAIHSRESGVTQPVAAPFYHYYADPFLVQEKGEYFLFIEDLCYLNDTGRLVVLHLDSSMRVQKTVPLSFIGASSRIECHASFPLVFKQSNSFYMIPETCGRLSIDLYKCEQWPERWTLFRTILTGLDAADNMVIFHDKKWWLLTSVRETDEQRHLEIYFTDDLLKGDFSPHPVNLKTLYADKRFGTGRNAGYFTKDAQGRIFRLMQTSESYYGQGSQLMEIVTLSETEFTEVPVNRTLAQDSKLQPAAWHHCSEDGDWIAFDHRTRTGFRS